MPTYYAHSAENCGESHWQTLKSHAENVAALAAQFAEPFGAADIARYTGLLHDLGKYSDPFQLRLAGSPQRVDHATAGAKEAIARWQLMGKLMAYCIAGHHAGLANGSGEGKGRSTLQERLAAQIRQQRAQRGKPIQQKIEKAEQIMAKLSAEQAECEAFLADEEAYKEHNKAKLHQYLAKTAEVKVQLAQTEEDWLALQEELEAVYQAVEQEFDQQTLEKGK